MKHYVTCSWCHEKNEARGDGLKTYCTICGYRADVPRLMCDCRKCRRREQTVDERKAVAA